MNIRSIVSSALLLTSSLALGPRLLAAPLNDASLPSSQFDVTEKTQVPGSTLTPGHYSIRVLDHLTDRLVLQIDNEQGKTRSTFLALPQSEAATGRTGAIPYGDAKNAALRGFAFSDGTSVEFVYPKAQAVAIARQNSTRVPAIDPPSEGLPADNKLSKQDMTLVTLWLLSPTFVGTESKPTGVLAQRYQAPAPAQTASPQPEVASNPQPTPRPAPAYQAVTPTPAPQPLQIAQNTPHRAVAARLPKTGSSMPLVWLFGGLSLFGALALRFRKAVSAPAGV